MHPNTNETRRALCLARDRIRAHGLCRGPLGADGEGVCLAGALGFTGQCSETIDDARRCGGARLNPTGVVAGGHEAIRLAAAERLTRLSADDGYFAEIDYFDGGFDDFDIEVLGDLCYEAESAQDVINVIDGADRHAKAADRKRR